MNKYLNREQVAILDHTLHRAANGLYCGDSDDMQQLLAMNMMEYAGKTGFSPDKYFRITSTGKTAYKIDTALRTRLAAGEEE